MSDEQARRELEINIDHDAPGHIRQLCQVCVVLPEPEPIHWRAVDPAIWREPERIGLCALETVVCPNCSEWTMVAEHAHFRCRHCGFRDSCCDGAAL